MSPYNKAEYEMDSRLLDKTWMHNRYVNEQTSANIIAQELNTTASTVLKYLRKYEIEIRPGGISKTLTSKQKEPNNPFLADKEWLYQKYVVEGLSTRDVANAANITNRRTVTKALVFHNISQRDIKQARTNRSNKGPEFRATSDSPYANDIEYTKKLYESGYTIGQICNDIGISTDAVRHRLTAAGAKMKESWEYRIGTKHSIETRQQMSKTACQQIVDGIRNTNTTGLKIRSITPHGGYTLMRSSYEKAYAEYLLANNIDFYYEPKKFALSNGQYYVPDFYLPETKEYIEIKGYLTNIAAVKYDLFKKDYPNIKWQILYKKDLELMGCNLNKVYPKVYMVCGTAGAGKSWVCEQLIEQYHYVSFDRVPKKDHVEVIRTASTDNTKLVLYDPNIKISTFIKRHSHEFDIVPIFIIEDENTIKERLISRGGKWTEHIGKRMKVMEARNKKYGVFSGTSSEVLDFLRVIANEYTNKMNEELNK